MHYVNTIIRDMDYIESIDDVFNTLIKNLHECNGDLTQVTRIVKETKSILIDMYAASPINTMYLTELIEPKTFIVCERI